MLADLTGGAQRLIGDIFTDQVDTVWGPMETLYAPGRDALKPWHQGHTTEQGEPLR